MSNKSYDVLKWLSLVAFDAVGVFYKTIATIWALPFGDEVLATFSAASLFLGTLVGVSSLNYKKNVKGASDGVDT